MVDLRLSSRRIVYSINIDRLLNDVYYSKCREMAREFVSLKVFTRTIFRESETISNEVIRKLYLGYSYLLAESYSDFINLGFDDDSAFEASTSISYVAGELLNNLVSHFCCALAFQLLDTTDIEDVLKYSIELSDINRQYVRFTYED